MFSPIVSSNATIQWGLRGAAYGTSSKERRSMSPDEELQALR
jgi:hypothetical protein